MKRLSKEEVQLELNAKRDHSWIKEIFERHQNEMQRPILDYFGTEITYSKLKEEAEKMAYALKKDGVKKGDEFVVFIDRIPEFVYIMAAASIIGARVNFCSEHFDKLYLKEILNNANSNIVFVQDYKLKELYDVLNDFDTKKVITVSHLRTLEKKEAYKSILDKFYNFSFNVDSKYMDYSDYVDNKNQNYENLYEDMTLDDPFTVTYSSGTTKKGYAKGIVHSIRHYITMGRYHDPEVSGLPSLKNYTTYSNIPCYSNSFILSTLSDNLILGGKIVLDPIDDPEYFVLGIKLHKSHVNIATTSTWLVNALNYYNKKIEVNRLPYLLFPFAAGEQLSAGEEKFLNKFLSDLKCGIAVTHTPFSIAKFSTAGADCEHGSIFIRLFRAICNELPYRIGRKEPAGMAAYDFVDIKVLRRDGTYCKPLEHGRLVVNSPCNMIEYNHNDEETKDFYIKDAYGKVWGDMKAYGFIDEKGYVSMKGRYTDNNLIPCYRIADEIMKDTKKIMSCEVVSVPVGDTFVYVAHIMPQYGTSFNIDIVLNSALSRCKNEFGEDIQNILYFRIHTLNEGFKITGSAKRNVMALSEEGLKKAFLINTEHQKVKVLK